MAKLFDDASSEYLWLNSAVATSEEISMACWFYSDSTTVNQTLISLGNNGTNGMFRLVAAGAVAGDPIRAQKQDDSGTTANSDTGTGYSTNTWHHAGAIFRTNTNRQAYIDGSAATANTTTVSDPTANFTSVGTLLRSSATNYMSGRIAEAAIWNVDIGSANMALLAKGMSPRLILPQNLIFYAPLTRNNQELIAGVNLTESGTPTVADHAPIIYPSAQILQFPPPAEGKITESIPNGSLTLSSGTPKDIVRKHEKPSSHTIVLTGTAPNLRIKTAITESISLGNLTLTGIAPNTRQVAPGKITEQVPSGLLALTGTAPSQRLKHHEPINNGSLLLTGTAPKAFVRYREGIASGLITLTGVAPSQRLRIHEIPQLNNLTLTGVAPNTRQSGKQIVSIPNGQLRLVSFNPNIPSAVKAVTTAGGGAKPSKPKVVVIGNKRYKVESYTELRRLLYQYMIQQQQELQEVEAKAPESKRIVTLKRNITRAETRLAKADELYKRIQEENELILLMFAA